MKNKILVILIIFLLVSFKEYRKGAPIITKKERSIDWVDWIYTYEGYGQESTFEDKDKYNVGDTLYNKTFGR